VNPVPISILSQQWLDDRAASGSVSPRTAQSYRYHFTNLVRCVGDIPVTDLTTDHLRAWMRSMAHREVSTRYVRLSAVASFCDWCVREGIIDRNPADRVERPKLRKGKPRPVASDAARKIVATTTDTRTRLIILLALEMGLRAGEIAGCRAENFDPEAGVLLVLGKGDKERHVPLTDGVVATMKDYTAYHHIHDGWLFPSAKRPGMHIHSNQVSKLVTRAAGRAGHRGVTTHRFRHRAGTDLAQTHGIHVAQYVLGHANISTTQVYAQHDLAQAIAAMQGRNFAA
jgi:integrase